MSLRTFMQTYRYSTWQNPVQAQERVWREQVALTVVPHTTYGTKQATLLSVRTFNRGTGWGTRALQWLTQLAQQHRVTLVGWVQPCGQRRPRLGYRALCKWYRKHGFTVSRDGHMRKVPTL